MTREDFIKDLIKKQGKNVKSFANDIGMPYTTLRSILNDSIGGAALDNVNKICDGLSISLNTLQSCNVQDDIELTRSEKNLVYAYRENKSMQSAVDRLLGIEKSAMNKYNISVGEKIVYFPVPYYTTAVSAGRGNFIDDSGYEMFQLKNEPPYGTDYILRVSGNSMEPIYFDGDKVFVSSVSNINVGEVGIFILDGDVYIKEMGIDTLISYNKSYPDIKFDEYTEVRCLGKVLGICNE